MKNFLVIKCIPLSETTRSAWREAGCTILPRKYGTNIPENYANEHNVIINLGNGELRVPNPEDHIIFNHPDTVWKTYSALVLRETLGNDFVPPYTIKGPHWHKNPGHKGKGKIFHEDIRGECAILSGDSQQHINGIEYRIITVGDSIVQAFVKESNASDPFDFYYSWVGVNGVKSDGFIPLIKSALEQIPDYNHSIFGVDVIHDGNRPWIIEINTSPGVNGFTANRIVKQVERIIA